MLLGYSTMDCYFFVNILPMVQHLRLYFMFVFGKRLVHWFSFISVFILPHLALHFSVIYDALKSKIESVWVVQDLIFLGEKPKVRNVPSALCLLVLRPPRPQEKGQSNFKSQRTWLQQLPDSFTVKHTQYYMCTYFKDRVIWLGQLILYTGANAS